MQENDVDKLLPNSSGPRKKPYEQHVSPNGMGDTCQDNLSRSTLLMKLERAASLMRGDQLQSAINRQTDLIYLPMVNQHKTSHTDLDLKAESNSQVWKYFITEQLFDTRRLTLEHFHLFEWFPIAPGKYHTDRGKQARRIALEMLERDPAGGYCFDPYGKSCMVEGGIGSVRLRPRQIAGEPHYFMTASSSGTCHEGFPVLIPRRFYGPIKQRIMNEGAAPVTLRGEMRYIPEHLVSFFEEHRNIPLLYLHVDDLRELPSPRNTITEFSVSVAVSFEGEFKDNEGIYSTYATFDPASSDSLAKACQWMESLYVEGQHKGVIITDFDEVLPKFSYAVFGLPDLMAGKLNRPRVKKLLKKYDQNDGRRKFYSIYKEINTQGGAYIEGNVNTDGGPFIGRDQIINNP